MLPLLRAPVLDPWAVAGPILKALAAVVVILIVLAALMGFMKRRPRRSRVRRTLALPAAQPHADPDAERWRLAYELLEFGRNELLSNRPFTPGKEIAELTIMGLYFKILANLESVIALAEKGLPTFALIREMVEALISAAYIAAADSVERASLYRDFVAVRRWKEANAQAIHPQLKGTVSAKRLKELEEARDQVTMRRGEQTVKDMMNPRKWKTWGGDMSIRQMAAAAGFSEVTYPLAYGWPSQSVHGLDADRYFEVSGDGVVRPALPMRPEGAVLPAASATLVAMEVIDKFLTLGKREAVLGFKQRIDQFVTRQRG